MYGNTLILDAFWVSNKKDFPTLLYPNSQDGRAFYDFYEGEARHLGWMDLVLLKSIIKEGNITHIILQNLDTLGKIAQETKVVKVCTSYNYHNFIIRTPSGDKDFKHCKPFYEDAVIGGWDSSENEYEVPIRAQRYIKFLLVHTRVNSITYMNDKIKFTASFDFLGNVKFKTEPNE